MLSNYHSIIGHCHSLPAFSKRSIWPWMINTVIICQWFKPTIRMGSAEAFLPVLMLSCMSNMKLKQNRFRNAPGLQVKNTLWPTSASAPTHCNIRRLSLTFSFMQWSNHVYHFNLKKGSGTKCCISMSSKDAACHWVIASLCAFSPSFQCFFNGYFSFLGTSGYYLQFQTHLLEDCHWLQ